MDPIDPFAVNVPSPTATHPLLGLTILVVEDSRFACEAIRLLCLRSGARIRRADSLRSARRHLRVYRPSVVIIDLGLPDGNGVDLIKELQEAQPPVEAVLAISGDVDTEQAARAAGAQGFMPKPITAIAPFQEAVLSLLPPDRHPNGPRMLSEEIIHPDRIAYQDDIAHVAGLLDDLANAQALDYAAQFVTGVAKAADDTALEQAAIAVSARRASGGEARTETAALVGIVNTRLSERIAI